MYRLGDPVVFTANKHSAHPGPRAEKVQPEPHGEGYSYDVKKFWLITEIRSDGTIAAITRRGKRRLVRRDDPRLRPARWWERLLYRSRFPQPPSDDESGTTAEQRGQLPVNHLRAG